MSSTPPPGSPKQGPRGSPPGPQGRSRSGSGASTSGRPTNPFGVTPLGHDPGREADPNSHPTLALKKDADNKNIDLPPEAYAKNPLDTVFTPRPGINEIGKKVLIEVNQFRIVGIDTSKEIYQYDIAISPEPKRASAVIKKCWGSRAVQEALLPYKVKWLYDGRKLAWAPVLVDRGEIRITVDLDEGRANIKPERVGKNKFLVLIRKTTKIDLSILPRYIKGQMGWHDGLLESMNFLDHVIRQGPSERLTSIKRNFFSTEARVDELDTYIDVIKGIYAAVRMNGSFNQGGVGLGLNVDVANTAFWKAVPMMELVIRYLSWCDRKFSNLRPEEVNRALAPVQENGRWSSSDAWKYLRRLHKLRFTVRHRGKTADPKVYSIHSFMFDEKYGAEGANSKTVKFEKNGRMISINEYFKEHYGHLLRHPNCPLIMTSKAGTFPIEVCTVVPMERYSFKLDGEQTSRMIKFAVTRPDQRKRDIMANRDALGWPEDPYMRQYGIKVDPNLARVPALILPNPEIQFAGSKLDPKVSGRWDLRGRKFYAPNKHKLVAWAFVGMERSIQMGKLQEFAGTFLKQYTGHGGIIGNPPLIIDQLNNSNHADALEKAYRQVIQKWGQCQMIFCILRAKNTGGYERLKKSADCRFGILTQMLQASHVEKNNLQYHSNVAMKVNAKLGGFTCRVFTGPGNPPMFRRPTMIIGADVSHAAPGSPVASMAAMTMSIDKDATRYAAACDTNGHRIEMLKSGNIHACMRRLLPAWFNEFGKMVPDHVYYFRDGVAESQFISVIHQELNELKRYFAENLNARPRFTVIIATKRHHIRFFPIGNEGDKNRNPLPGTLVEREVTHPFHWDFYLCSHVAIQGTARPVHYSVIVDEAKLKPEELQRMLYTHCYQYIRSTTPVSLHPAVYYAHLASNRARYHENVASSKGFRSGGKAVETQRDRVGKEILKPKSLDDEAARIESLPLLPLGGDPTSSDSVAAHRAFINSTMWFI